MKSTAEVLKDVLVAAGLGVYEEPLQDWNIFIGSGPENPDSIITLTDQDGITGETLKRELGPWSHPLCQVRVRSITYKAGYSKCMAVLRAIAQTDRFTEAAEDSGEPDVRWVSFVKMNGPQPLTKDSHKRYIFVGNIRASKEELA